MGFRIKGEFTLGPTLILNAFLARNVALFHNVLLRVSNPSS